jgi:anaerobic magnesium-protoporphyrin IX monomethyl ester cyclase
MVGYRISLAYNLKTMPPKSRVAIVFPCFRTRSRTEMLFPPLGAAALASQLRQRGLQTRVFDCTFGSVRQVHKALLAYQPDIVGIYSMISLSRNTFRLATMVRASLPGSLVVAGGPMPTLYPDRYGPPFDAVFRGESDLSFPRFCRDFGGLNGSRQTLEELPLETYEGLFVRDGALEVDNPAIHYGERDIDSFPLPDRSDFDHAAYQRVWLEKAGTKTTSIITTLGCPFDCDFCSKPVFGDLFRRRNLDAVFEEIEQIRGLGYDSLWIADDNFTLSSAHLDEFCRRMVGRNMTWSCLSRSTGIDQALALQMKEAGCSRVYLGLESGSQDTLVLMNKKARLPDSIDTVHRLRAAGIEVAAFFIVGYPGETISSIEETFRLALTLPLNHISFNVPFPLPGSTLFDRVIDVRVDQDWTQENEVTFVYKSEFDARWLRRRIAQTIRTFEEKRK